MKRVLFVIAVLALLVFAGCAAPEERAEDVDAGVVAEPVIEEATSEFIDEADTVEIGEML